MDLPVPVVGRIHLLAEWRRIADRGDRGFVISGYPSGEAVPTDTDDRFWSEVEEQYVLYARHMEGGKRATARSSTKDFLTWTPEVAMTAQNARKDSV